jgi:RNA polymerase sigma factor (TIGR02999 family)
VPPSGRERDVYDAVTLLLERIAGGESAARAEVVPLLYDELRRLARARMAHLAPGQTLQPTALVHEAFLRLEGHPSRDWQSRRNFFFAASRAMHDILVESARRKGSLKRGGALQRINLEGIDPPIEAPTTDMLQLESALARLAAEDPDGHEIVMLRYFAGLTMEEVAATVGVSLSTVERRWRFLRSWLGARLEEDRGE